MKRWDKLESCGYKYHSFEYDGDAQNEKNKLEKQGFIVKLLRAKTDTKGLKMYSVWIKEA